MERRKIDVIEAAGLYGAGRTTVELAARYGVAPRSVRKALLRAGVTMRPPHRGSQPKIPTTVRAQAIAQYRKGASQAQIATDLAIGQSSVARILATAGMATRPHGLRRQTVTIPADLAVLGYIAGMLDGEGNLQVRREKSVGCKVAIYSTTAEVLDWLTTQVGGKVRWDHARTRRGWKPIGIWELTRARDVFALLTALLPYLIIKRAAAIEMLALLGPVVSHDWPPATPAA
jgi:hypothetical protein